MNEQLSEAFVKTCSLLLARGYKDLCNTPGCIEHDINDDWHIKLNPHNEPATDSNDSEIKPFSMIVLHKEMPVGLIGPYDGALMFGAEQDYIAVLDEQINAIQGQMN